MKNIYSVLAFSSVLVFTSSLAVADVDEIVVTGVRNSGGDFYLDTSIYSPTSDSERNNYMNREYQNYYGARMYVGPACDNIERDFAQCTVDAAKIRYEEDQKCAYYTAAGVVTGFVIVGGFIFFTGGTGIVILSGAAGGAIPGGGLGLYATNTCYKNDENRFATNNAICANNREKMKKICGK